MVNITLKTIANDYFSDYARDTGVYDCHVVEIYADDIEVGTFNYIDQFNEDNDTCCIGRIDIDEAYKCRGIGVEVLASALYVEYCIFNVIVAHGNEDVKRLYAKLARRIHTP